MSKVVSARDVLAISDAMNVSQLRKQFLDRFGLPLRVFNPDGTLADDKTQLGTITQPDKKSDHAHYAKIREGWKLGSASKVDGVELVFLKAFGLTVEVRTADDAARPHRKSTLKQALAGIEGRARSGKPKTQAAASETDAHITMTAENPQTVTLNIEYVGYRYDAKLNVAWGDGTSNIYDVDDDNGLVMSKTYDAKGTYKITVTLTEGELNEVELNCTGSNLTTIDASNCEWLKVLKCENNLLTSLLLRQDGNLTQLTCHDNQLTELDLNGNRITETLDCSNNRLTYLRLVYVGDNGINCSNNKLTGIDVEFDEEYEAFSEDFDCSNNELDEDALNDLFNSIGWGENLTINFQGNPGERFCDGEVLIENEWTVEGWQKYDDDDDDDF
jgi:hypothetical protein